MSKIERAALKSGRKADDIKLCSYQNWNLKIFAILDEGITELGENRVQELVKSTI